MEIAARILRRQHIFKLDQGVVSCCIVAKLCPTLRDPMAFSMPGFPVHHHLPELEMVLT